ncbi:MAG TPA: hypothetical protein ENO08_08195 [Candidatus Eisenbacteria bacterium]|uniref:Glycosyl hydrolase-like 10 domain-containing protein n=1 Tax=Eiseniibacteriota bacterium TaxID=2212470 RepID=A0A7V2AWB7_UNCEI|nr:hypothetical protein [Candidatus Eisenbacteria bacterium]
MHRHIAITIAALIGCVSCGAENPGVPDELVGASRSSTYPERGVVHWAPFDGWDDETISQAGRSKAIVVPMDRCFAKGSWKVIERLRELNPDIQIVAYLPVLLTYQLPADTTGLKEVLPFLFDYYDAVKSDWARTTTGDTLMIWPGGILLDPIADNDINRDLIAKIADLIEAYQEGGGPRIDGIMHDYFMYSVYINPACRPGVEGEPDLDGDLVPCSEDRDERELLLLWQKEYLRELRRRFGEDFVMIGNGRPPQEDAELAGLLNGIFYESFPNGPWCWTDREGFLRLLDNQSDGFLSTAKGRTWSILANDQLEQNNFFCLVSSLIAGCLYTELHGSYTFTGWTLSVDSGPPAGEAVLEGNPDSLLTASRAFRNGEARISFNPNGGRNETVFEPAR